ncbi:hypothetical protein [Labilibaculum euxinus]|uniref:Uncharacterized protein n=1 Tax=Labilibaculum euxinus TaxID=2686357 RepID=A0A7M4D6R9_9BACT|nr:hypothetical protein [Labilibaculum euxinus]MUP38348.1 hypothetical protein [Labilibaculum euxinus]MVB07553.1 hypothetical protein [Labilibaculum euxinus]
MFKEKKQKNNSCLLQAIASLIGGIIFWYIMKSIFLWIPNLAELLGYVQVPLKESITWRIVGLLTAVGISIIIYQLKNRIIIIFGLIEITGGGWTIWETFSQHFENNVLYALAIAGGIFLFVNGFDNMMKQEKKRNQK